MCLNKQSKIAHTLALTKTHKHQDFAALLYEEATSLESGMPQAQGSQVVLVAGPALLAPLRFPYTM